MSLRDIRDLLGEHQFFAGLEASDLDEIAGCGVNVHFDEQATIFREGDRADTFYVLRRGKAALEIHGPSRGALVIETLGAGEVLGWAWLFPPYRWQSDARAVEATSAIALDGACLRGKADADPRLGYRLMLRFARLAQEQLAATQLRLLDLYAPNHAATDG